MKKEKQVCDFGIKNFNKIKRTGVQLATRGSGGVQKGKPVKGDKIPPVISNIVISNITDTTFTVSWNTNEETTGKVEYGTTTTYGFSKNSSGSTTHTVTVEKLSVGTTYNFRIISTDLRRNVTYSINQTVATSGSVTKVFYLEFYGTTVANTFWNVRGTFEATHSGLTVDEINSIVTRIQSAFEPFNVLVTIDLDTYNNTPVDKKQKIIFTEYNEWYGSGAGGVAYLNSFGWADQSPAFVFTKLLNYNAHDIAEAACHEMGHTSGCRHQSVCQDGVKVSEYNWGDGVNAPIMGASYGVPEGDWWVGPSALNCIIQDDVQIIQTKFGLKS